MFGHRRPTGQADGARILGGCGMGAPAALVSPSGGGGAIVRHDPPQDGRQPTAGQEADGGTPRAQSGTQPTSQSIEAGILQGPLQLGRGVA
jgi:hypothetical protein